MIDVVIYTILVVVGKRENKNFSAIQIGDVFDTGATLLPSELWSHNWETRSFLMGIN